MSNISEAETSREIRKIISHQFSGSGGCEQEPPPDKEHALWNCRCRTTD